MATEESKAKFKIGQNGKVESTEDGKANEGTTSTENKNPDGSDKSTDQNVGGESGGFKQVDQAATTLANNSDSANNNDQTNEPGKGAAPSNEGNTGNVADNGPKATEARLEQSKDLEAIEGKGYNPPVDSFGGPTAKDLGVDSNARSPLAQAFAQQAAADAGVSGQSDEVVYSSHPIQNYQVGPYHFEKSVLRLDPDQAADFDKLLASMPLTESRHVQKIDTDKVDQIVAARFPNGTQNIDSSAGRAALEQLSKTFPKIGTESIEDRQTAHANIDGLDNNTNIGLAEGIPENPFDAKFNG